MIIRTKMGGVAFALLCAVGLSTSGAAEAQPCGIVVLGRDGSTWVRLNGTAAADAAIVLGPKGTVTGSVALKRNLDIVEADARRVWAVDVDSDGLGNVGLASPANTASASPGNSSKGKDKGGNPGDAGSDGPRDVASATDSGNGRGNGNAHGGRRPTGAGEGFDRVVHLERRSGRRQQSQHRAAAALRPARPACHLQSEAGDRPVAAGCRC